MSSELLEADHPARLRPWQKRQRDGILWLLQRELDDRRARTRIRLLVLTVSTGAYAGAAAAAYVVLR